LDELGQGSCGVGLRQRLWVHLRHVENEGGEVGGLVKPKPHLLEVVDVVDDELLLR
jgi:hypothetical protein